MANNKILILISLFIITMFNVSAVNPEITDLIYYEMEFVDTLGGGNYDLNFDIGVSTPNTTSTAHDVYYEIYNGSGGLKFSSLQGLTWTASGGWSLVNGSFLNVDSAVETMTASVVSATAPDNTWYISIYDETDKLKFLGTTNIFTPIYPGTIVTPSINTTPYFSSDLVVSLDTANDKIIYSYNGTTEFTNITSVEELLKDDGNGTFVQAQSKSSQFNIGNVTYSNNSEFILSSDGDYKVKVTLISDGISISQESVIFTYNKIIRVSGGGGSSFIPLSITSETTGGNQIQNGSGNGLSYFNQSLSFFGKIWIFIISFF